MSTPNYKRIFETNHGTEVPNFPGKNVPQIPISESVQTEKESYKEKKDEKVKKVNNIDQFPL